MREGDLFCKLVVQFELQVSYPVRRECQEKTQRLLSLSFGAWDPLLLAVGNKQLSFFNDRLRAGVTINEPFNSRIIISTAVPRDAIPVSG